MTIWKCFTARYAALFTLWPGSIVAAVPVCAEVLEQTLVYKGVPRAAVPDTPASDAETSADLPEDGDSFDGA